MKYEILVLFTYFILCFSTTLAKDECFTLFDLQTHKILKQEGDICNVQLTPCSTFKIALSLIGYDTKILKNQRNPEWHYCSCYQAPLPIWRATHNPTSWIKNSCIWYSRVLTKKLGMKKFKQCVDILDYGNKDVAGDPGKNNGLTLAWLSSSLKISNREQVTFLEKMLDKKFPFSSHAYDMTKQIIFIEKLSNGWDLYGKTGSGFKQNTDGSSSDKTISWFIGFAIKNDRTIIFVRNVIDKNLQCPYLKDSMKQFILKDKIFINTFIYK